MARARSETDAVDKKDRLSTRLMRIPGVSAVGVERDDGGAPVLVVRIDPAFAASAKKHVPDSFEHVPVVVVMDGPFRRQS